MLFKQTELNFQFSVQLIDKLLRRSFIFIKRKLHIHFIVFDLADLLKRQQLDFIYTLIGVDKIIKEIEEVPGSYYVSRAVDQAFWNVVTNGRNHKDVLIEWGKIADDEIARKISEYK